MEIIIAVITILILYSLQFIYYKKNWNKNLSVCLTYSKQEAEYGENVNLIETIHNNKKLPVPVLFIKFKFPLSFHFQEKEHFTKSDSSYKTDVFTLLTYQKITRTLSFKNNHRGCFPIHSIDYMTYDLLFMHKLVKKTGSNSTLYVFAKPLSFDQLPNDITSAIGEFTQPHSLYDDPFLFRGLREYTPSDAPNTINWKVSAKYGSVYVNQYEHTTDYCVHILLNISTQVPQANDFLVENCISLACEIANKLIHSGIHVSFSTNGHDFWDDSVISLPADNSTNHYHNIRIACARIDTEKKPSSFENVLENYAFSQKSPNIKTIIISNERHLALQKTFASLYAKDKKTLWLIPEKPGTQVNYNHIRAITWEVPEHDD